MLQEQTETGVEGARGTTGAKTGEVLEGDGHDKGDHAKAFLFPSFKLRWVFIVASGLPSCRVQAL